MAFVSGTVVRATTGKPLEKASVEISDASYTTGAGGCFRIDVQKGNNDLVVMKEGFATYLDTIKVEKDMSYGTIRLIEV